MWNKSAALAIRAKKAGVDLRPEMTFEEGLEAIIKELEDCKGSLMKPYGGFSNSKAA